jgi:hypothetical protein
MSPQERSDDRISRARRGSTKGENRRAGLRKRPEFLKVIGFSPRGAYATPLAVHPTTSPPSLIMEPKQLTERFEQGVTSAFVRFFSQR